MSLYGRNPKYWKGALKNVRLVRRFYPEWMLRLYCSNEVDTKPFSKFHCQIIMMGQSFDHSGMFWRFLPAWERGIDYVIFRDTDSRFNSREAAAVKEWLASGKNAHTMCDHLHHRGLPLFGGMWGVKGGILSPSSLVQLNYHIKKKQRRVDDMRFLAKRIYPQIENSILRHSSVHVRWPYVPFPAHEPYGGFVGQQYDGNGSRIHV
jgi:hypothetical protein